MFSLKFDFKKAVIGTVLSASALGYCLGVLLNTSDSRVAVYSFLFLVLTSCMYYVMTKMFKHYLSRDYVKVDDKKNRIF